MREVDQNQNGIIETEEFLQVKEKKICSLYSFEISFFCFFQ